MIAPDNSRCACPLNSISRTSSTPGRAAEGGEAGTTGEGGAAPATCVGLLAGSVVGAFAGVNPCAAVGGAPAGAGGDIVHVTGIGVVLPTMTLAGPTGTV